MLFEYRRGSSLDEIVLGQMWCAGLFQARPERATAEPLPKTGDADGFDCPMHYRFKVAGTVFATRSSATRQEWEKAFDRAKTRAKPDEYPLIGDSDF